jgi:hypothetical protein
MRPRILPLLAFALALTGCASQDAPVPRPVDLEAGLKELGEIYRYRAGEKLPPPSRVEDLAEYDAALENALPAIRDGSLVVVWRVGYSAGSTAVLAYAKDAPAEGGKVLLRNGTVQDMTAAEFKAAKK